MWPPLLVLNSRGLLVLLSHFAAPSFKYSWPLSVVLGSSRETTLDTTPASLCPPFLSLCQTPATTYRIPTRYTTAGQEEGAQSNREKPMSASSSSDSSFLASSLGASSAAAPPAAAPLEATAPPAGTEASLDRPEEMTCDDGIGKRSRQQALTRVHARCSGWQLTGREIHGARCNPASHTACLPHHAPR